MSEQVDNRGTKKNDIIGIAAIVAIALIVAIGYQVYAHTGLGNSSEGPFVVIQSVDKTIYSEPLSKSGEFEVKNQFGTNLVKIENNSVWVDKADCDNQICVNTGKISNPGDMIVCLPHQVLIQVVKSPEDAVPLNG